jgi:ketosteroid isomerase-like protein
MTTVAKDTNTWVKNLFAIVDNGTPEELAQYFADDGVLRFGNAEPVVGRENIREASRQFRLSLAGLEHEVLSAWRFDDTIMTELSVTYHRHDGQTLVLPCANAFDLTADGLIARYQIYMDIAPVFTEA